MNSIIVDTSLILFIEDGGMDTPLRVMKYENLGHGQTVKKKMIALQPVYEHRRDFAVC